MCTCVAGRWAEDGLESGKLSDLSTLGTEENLHSGKQELEVTPLHNVPLPSQTPGMQEQHREQEKTVDITFKNQE